MKVTQIFFYFFFLLGNSGNFFDNFPGNPVPDIKWLKDGQPLVSDRHHQIVSYGRFLQIFEAQVADTGRYSCMASNSAGDRSKHYNLNVLGTKTTSLNLPVLGMT